MYTLRIIESNGIVSNHYLGNAYSRIRKNVCKSFKFTMDKDYPDTKTDNIDSLIVGATGETFFIYEQKATDNYYFIMTDSGQTFERL